ncbi:MAG: YceI family protein [Sphingomicrobium sp.]
MSIRPFATLAALLLPLGAASLAQMPTVAPGAPIASRVVAGTYDIEPSHSQVLFSVNHLGFSLYSGQFTNPTGTLTIDPKQPGSAKVDVSFPIKDVRTTVAALDAHLQKPEFFDADKFPVGRFVSTRVVATGTTAMIDGNLTLKGVTRPVTLKARFVGAGPAVMGPPKLNFGFAATTMVKRSDFGISAGVPLVSDNVELTINAAFVGK